MKPKAQMVARCTDEHTWLHRARLEALYEADQEITADTFFRHVSLKEVSAELGYAFGHEVGLHLKADYHVSYYRSTWRGVPCLHLEWSRIDHIFVQDCHRHRMSDTQFFA